MKVLGKSDLMHPRVKEHMEQVAAGNIPWGYSVTLLAVKED